MRVLYFILVCVLSFSGCSRTWQGVKEDADSAKQWTKKKINNGASYIKEKTE